MNRPALTSFTLISFIILLGAASACEVPYDDMQITTSTVLCTGVYNLLDPGNDGVIRISADNVVLDCNGSTLQGQGQGKAIFNWGKHDITVKNCTVRTYENGIEFQSSNNSKFIENSVYTCTNGGIILAQVHNASVQDNLAEQNYIGIWLHANSDRSRVAGNTVRNNEYNGILFQRTTNSAITQNTVVGGGMGAAIRLQQSDNNLVDSNFVNSTSYGLSVESAEHNTFSNNNIINAANHAILLWDPFNQGPSSFNQVIGNNISGGVYGIYLTDAAIGNTISQNNIVGSIAVGIELRQSKSSLVEQNRISNSGEGIRLYSINSTTIRGNTVTNSSLYGIDVGLSRNNQLTQNNFSGNYIAVLLVNSFTTTLFYNSIYGSSNYNIRNEGSAAASAERNWWGPESGEVVTIGNTIYGAVDFIPFSSAPYPAANAIMYLGSPEAEAGPDQSYGAIPATAHFDGSASSDPDGAITEYRWNFDGATVIDIIATHTYNAFGNHTVDLAVRDSEGLWDMDSANVFIAPTVPYVEPPIVASYCGNGVCDVGETFENCPQDCPKRIGQMPKADKNMKLMFAKERVTQPESKQSKKIASQSSESKKTLSRQMLAKTAKKG